MSCREGRIDAWGGGLCHRLAARIAPPGYGLCHPIQTCLRRWRLNHLSEVVDPKPNGAWPCSPGVCLRQRHEQALARAILLPTTLLDHLPTVPPSKASPWVPSSLGRVHTSTARYTETSLAGSPRSARICPPMSPWPFTRVTLYPCCKLVEPWLVLSPTEPC